MKLTPENLIDTIKKAMELNKMTNADISKATGLDNSLISRYMRKIVYPNVETTFKIFNAVGIIITTNILDKNIFTVEVPEDNSFGFNKGDKLVVNGNLPTTTKGDYCYFKGTIGKIITLRDKPAILTPDGEVIITTNLDKVKKVIRIIREL